MLKIYRFILLTVFTLVWGNVLAASFSEDFENVTITDANSWGYGTALSNGWMIVGGQVSNTSNTEYTLKLKEESTYLGKDNSKGLAALYASTNNAFIVTNEVSGKVTLNVANYGTAAASIYIYEAIANGETYTKGETILYSKTWIKNNSRRTPEWEDAEFEIGSTAKRLAIVMVKATMDNFAAGEDNVAPVKAPNLSITSGEPSANVTIEDGGYVTILYENNGDADATNAKLTLFVNNQENKVEDLGTISAGYKNGFKSIAYNMTDIKAGTYPVYVKLTADNDAGDGVKQTTPKDVTFANKVVETTYTITSNDVTVAYDATSYNVVATVTSSADANDVKVELLNGTTVMATKTVNLIANTPQDVILTIENGPFTAGTTDMQVVVANKVGKWIKVIVEEAPVAEVKDLAIDFIQGTIDLALQNNTLTVQVKNNGTVDINDALVTLTAGSKTLGTATVSAKANSTGFCMVSVNTEGIEAGNLDVTAKVTVENDATPADNEKTQTITVKAIPAPEATFALTVSNAEFVIGNPMSITVNVENTSEVDAKNVEVKILNGMTQLGVQTIDELKAGANKDVVFSGDNFALTQEAGTYDLQAIAGNTGKHFTVILTEPVAPVIDINLTAIQGITEINLKEENKIQVWFENNSNVDVENATITVKMNGVEVGNATIAKGENYKEFTLPTEGLTAGETATVVATLTVKDNKEGNTFELSKTLNIVSGEVEPQPEIALNGISNRTVEPGEQKISVSVGVFNNGEVDAKDVKIDLYKSYPTILDTKTIDLKAGESTIVNFEFTYNFDKEGDYEFTVQTLYSDANVDNNTQKFTISCKAPMADLSVVKIADMQATTEDEVKVDVTIKNTTDIAAESVIVAMFEGETEVGIRKTIDVAANETATVQFNLGKLTAGTHNYNVQIVSTDANAENNIQTFTVKVTEPVVPVIDMAVITINGSEIDLQAEQNAITVWYQNNSNVAVTGAKLTVKMNGTEIFNQDVDAEAGKNSYVTVTLPTEGLVAGEKVTIVATITVADDTNAENNELSKELNIVDGTPVVATFALTANDVDVTIGQDATATITVKNTSEVDAQNVDVTILYGMTEIAKQTIDELKAGASKDVVFTIAAAQIDQFIAQLGNKTSVELQAVAGNSSTFFVANFITPVVAKIDMAISAIQGISKIDLQKENKIQVWYNNNSNVEVESANINVTLNGTALDAQTVSNIKVNANGYVEFLLPTEGLTAGTNAKVVATVNALNDENASNDSFEREYEVIDGEPIEVTFSVVAQDVTVEYGAESFDIVAVVKNTSEVAAENVEVKLLSGITTVDSKTIATLAAGAEETVTFTIAGPFEAGKTATYYVQAAGKAQAEVNVTFAKEPVAEVIDLAIASISGNIDLTLDNNYLTVYVENKGNVNVENATVTLSAGGTVLGTNTVSVNAGKSKLCSITFSSENLTVGDMEFVAKVEVENDADLTNNELAKTITIAAPEVELTITTEEVTTTTKSSTIEVVAHVKNDTKFDAKNVTVKLQRGNEVLAEHTVAKVAANSTETVKFIIENPYKSEGTYKDDLFVLVGKTVKYVKVTVTKATGIQAIKAQYGENVQIFTLSGNKVTDVKKGLYIINGKKVMVK